jgi:hypothetical protein
VADVPLVQKLIIRAARDAGKHGDHRHADAGVDDHQPEPTRAEASDVANAVLDGTSALMLSGETAVGRYPLEAVAMMHRIASAVEPSLTYHDPALRRDGEMAAILSHAACDIAEELGAPVIAVPTQSGSTARQVSRYRPRRPIVAASPFQHVLQQLALDWAVVPIVIDDADTIEQLWRQRGGRGQGQRPGGGRRPGGVDRRNAAEPAGLDQPHPCAHARVGIRRPGSKQGRMGPVIPQGRDRSPFTFRRVAAASVLLLMAALYVSPVQKYLRSDERLQRSQTQVVMLQHEHDRLQSEAAALLTKARIVELARACGWIYPGEHPLVIRDIPASAATQCG